MFFSNSLKTDRRLFRAEIRASIAHCDGLFRAGAITRLEAERIKNGLWTILKRADFDRNYFDNASQPDIYTFVEARLFQLINEAAEALKIGRSRSVRAAVALRLWLRDEIETIVEALENLTETLQSRQDKTFFADFAESFRRDETRLREIAARTNQMPCPMFDGSDETTAEIDFELIAHELGFSKALENPADSISDRDFCVEFASAAALAGLHLSNLANTVLNKFETDETNRQSLQTIRGKSVKTFGHPMTLLSLLKGLPIEPTDELDEVCVCVFDVADTLKSCLSATSAVLQKLA